MKIALKGGQRVDYPEWHHEGIRSARKVYGATKVSVVNGLNDDV